MTSKNFNVDVDCSNLKKVPKNCFMKCLAVIHQSQKCTMTNVSVV